MIKNERGSSLLIVMLMMLIFTILGLAIVSASIGGAKRTVVREEEVMSNLDAIRALNEGVAYIKSSIHSEYNSYMEMSEYQDLIDSILSYPSTFSIKDISSHYSIDLNEDYTRVLEVSAKYQEGKYYRQKVYISSMPGFLKYALGSRDQLTINGSILFQGNLYANNELKISNVAKYIYHHDNKEIATSFPSALDREKSQIYLENERIQYCSANCYRNGEEVNAFWSDLPLANLENAFDPNPPILTKDETEFVEVDITKTFIEKLTDGGFPVSSQSNRTDRQIINETIDNVPLDGSGHIQVLQTFQELDSSYRGYLFHGSAFIDTNNLIINKRKWLVINGDAYFENIGDETMNVSANILVTGDVYIKGKIAFDSTIYVLGNTNINNVHLSGYKDSELILMTQKNLDIAKINKFYNPDSTDLDSINSIKAYLYTASDAEVYAIGSYIFIEGGIFAKEDLEINAYRGKTQGGTDDLIFSPESDAKSSRLIIKNNKRLFLNQAQGLPKVDKLEVLTDLMDKD